MRKKRLFSAAALSVSMALSLSACVVKDGKIETDPTSQTTTAAVKDTEDVKETSVTESSKEVTTTVDVGGEPVSEEETPTSLEESTENDTEEVTDEVTTEEESTEEDTTPEETTAEEDPTPEETTTPEPTTPEPTTPEPTTPEPTTEQPTTPEPLIVETTTVKEPETKVELVSIKAEVKGTHYIGDTLTGNDFVVTGTYSDGHTESLNGWGADPLKLTSAETKITVSKGIVKTVITVKAQEKPAVTVASVSATVSGTHYIGDTLSGSDFTVTVKMSNGSTLTNPAGWSAAPLTLSAASTNITVTYGGVSGVVTVSASERPTQPVVNDNLGTVYTGDEMLAYIWHTYLEKGCLTYYSTDWGGTCYCSKNYTYGNPYVCSTFVQAVFAQFGMNVSSDINTLYYLAQSSPNVIEVPWTEAKAGDIAVSNVPIYQYTGHCGVVINPYEMFDCTPGRGIGVASGELSKYKILRFKGNTLANTLNSGEGEGTYYQYLYYNDVPNLYEASWLVRKTALTPGLITNEGDTIYYIKVDKTKGLIWQRIVNPSRNELYVCSVNDENFSSTFNIRDYQDIDGTQIANNEYTIVSGCYAPAEYICVNKIPIYPQYAN